MRNGRRSWRAASAIVIVIVAAQLTGLLALVVAVGRTDVLLNHGWEG